MSKYDAEAEALEALTALNAAHNGSDRVTLTTRALSRAHAAGDEAGYARGVAEERERVEKRAWPGVEGYALDDCTSCPFGNFDDITEKKPRGACDAGFTLCRPFTAQEDKADGPPAWCVLRSGGIYVALTTTPDKEVA